MKVIAKSECRNAELLLIEQAHDERWEIIVMMEGRVWRKRYRSRKNAVDRFVDLAWIAFMERLVEGEVAICSADGFSVETHLKDGVYVSRKTMGDKADVEVEETSRIEAVIWNTCFLQYYLYRMILKLEDSAFIKAGVSANLRREETYAWWDSEWQKSK